MIITISQKWAAHANVSPREITADNPTIRVGYFAGNHSDDHPFDGPGRVVAHTFLPPPGGENVNDLHGDIHLDLQETWSRDGAGGK